MYVLITILILLASILLIFIVLVQNSKGGGLASGFSSSNQVMGVRKTTDFLEKATWSLAGVIAILSIASAGFMGTAEVSTKQSMIKEEVQNAVNVDPNLSSPKFNSQPAAAGTETQAAATEAPAPAASAPAPAASAPAAQK